MFCNEIVLFIMIREREREGREKKYNVVFFYLLIFEKY